jgi:hypothetical protein
MGNAGYDLWKGTDPNNMTYWESTAYSTTTVGDGSVCWDSGPTMYYKVRGKDNAGNYGDFTGTETNYPSMMVHLPLPPDPKGKNIPTQYALFQNSPNPFNPSTKIEYGLPKNAKVSLTVFDILGREVATLVNDDQVAGWHAATFDASALPSGLYFYRLRTGDYSAMKKMLLIK